MTATKHLLLLLLVLLSLGARVHSESSSSVDHAEDGDLEGDGSVSLELYDSDIEDVDDSFDDLDPLEDDEMFDEVDEELENLDKELEEIANDVTIIEDDGDGRRYLESKTGCKVVKNMHELASMNGKTETLCSFEFTSQNKGCSVGNGGIGITKDTSLTCEKGGTCHINCPTRHFLIRSSLSLVGNFVFEGSMHAALLVQKGKLNMMGATLKNNPRLPALFSHTQGVVTVCSSTFEGNGGHTNDGGAIFMHLNSKLYATGCTFRNNKAKNRGGAIYAVGRRNGNEAFADIQDCTFEGNNAKTGDHIYSEPHPHHSNGFLTDACTGGTKFTGSKTCNGVNFGPKECLNTCTVPEGAGAYHVNLDLWEPKPEGVCASSFKKMTKPSCISVKTMRDLNLLTLLRRKTDFSATICPFHFTKQNGACNGPFGGLGKNTLTCQSGGSCLVDCPIPNHIHLGHPLANLEVIGNWVFSGATRTSAVVKSGTLNLRGVTFKGNKGHHSGAVFLWQNTAHTNICDCLFEENTGFAGAIRSYIGNRIMISGSTFRRNSAGGYGGAIYASGNGDKNSVMVAIKRSKFEDNKAKRGGDQIWSDNGQFFNGFKTDTCEQGGTTFTGSESDCNGIMRGTDGCVETSHCIVPYDFMRASAKTWPVSRWPKFQKWETGSLDEFCPAPTPAPTPAKPEDKKFGGGGKGSGSGDPHFKTWLGDKYDYHGECDLVLVSNPTFNNGQGLKVHIRTTRVKYFSFIEKVALQIGSDVLEFDNDVENFLINGEMVEANRKHHKAMLGPYKIRRDPKAISIRLADGTGPHQKNGAAKIDLVHRKNGFPAVIVDGGNTEIFKGSLGLLGEWGTGRFLARDGKTEIPVSQQEATEFALEWQVRDDEPMLFKESRFPQFPATCTPPAKMADRLGASHWKKEAEEACAHWEEDMEDCIFDVIATRDVLVAQEGHIVPVE